MLFFIFSEITAKKNQVDNISSIDFIVENIGHLSKNDDKLKLYLKTAMELGNQADLIRFEKLVTNLPPELLVYQKKFYENFYIEYSQSRSLAELKTSLMTVEEKNLRDYIIEKICFFSLTKKELKNYDILLPLISQTVIRSRAALLLVEYFINLNNIDKANEMVLQISFPAQKDMAHSLIATAYSSIVDYERAIYFLNEINEFELKEKTIKSALKNFTDKSLFKIAFEFLNMLSTQKDYDEALLVFIQKYMEEKKYSTANQLFEEINTPEIKEDALYIIAVEYAKDGNEEGVNLALNYIQSENKKDQTIHDSAVNLANQSKFDASMELVKLISNYSLYQSAIQDISGVLGKAENTNYSILLLQQIKDEDLFLVALESFIYSLVSEQKLKETLTLFDYIKDDNLKQEIIFNNLMVMLDTNQFDSLPIFDQRLTSEPLKHNFYYEYANYINETNNSALIPVVLLKIKEISNTKDIDLLDQFKFSFVIARLEIMRNNLNIAKDHLDSIQKLLIKVTEEKYDKIKIELIQLLLELNEEKNAFLIMESLSSKYKKINALFLIQDKNDQKEELNQKKLLEAFTKKINK